MSRFTKLDLTAQLLAATVTDHALVLDNTTGLTWTAKDAVDEDVTHEEAEAAIASLNEQKFGGFDDWRLPTVEELFLLADRTKVRPAIDSDVFPDTKNDWYWTGTPDCEAPSECAWFVDFGGGLAYIHGRVSLNRVRAVRGPARQ